MECIVMGLNFGTPKTINFPFGTNGKLIILGAPIFKHMTEIIVTALFDSFHICKLCMI